LEQLIECYLVAGTQVLGACPSTALCIVTLTNVTWDRTRPATATGEAKASSSEDSVLCQHSGCIAGGICWGNSLPRPYRSQESPCCNITCLFGLQTSSKFEIFLGDRHGDPTPETGGRKDWGLSSGVELLPSENFVFIFYNEHESATFLRSTDEILPDYMEASWYPAGLTFEDFGNVFPLEDIHVKRK
jgi:hypothetical protein